MSADEVKPTRGPWRVGAPPEKVCTNYGGGDDVTRNGWGKTIVTCKRSSWMSEGEEFANARLIAAAPELLEALKELLELTDDPNNDADPEESTFSFARSVVAKAEGRSNA